LYPDPRVRLGLLLSRNRAATACMDLSDGLADAVPQVAEASGVGAIVDADALPIDSEARAWFVARGTDATIEAIAGGDDYELLVAARPRLGGRLAAALAQGGAPLTRIGTCTADRAVLLGRASENRVIASPLPRVGYGHFR
jgi:thiamine-monophosphate kinase